MEEQLLFLLSVRPFFNLSLSEFSHLSVSVYFIFFSFSLFLYLSLTLILFFFLYRNLLVLETVLTCYKLSFCKTFFNQFKKSVNHLFFLKVRHSSCNGKSMEVSISRKRKKSVLTLGCEGATHSNCFPLTYSLSLSLAFTLSHFFPVFFPNDSLLS